MKPKRSEGQTFVGIWLDAEFVAALDAARAKAAVSRSQFFRSAVAEALQRSGITVDQRKTVAPDRTGKGGPRRSEERYEAPADPVVSAAAPAVVINSTPAPGPSLHPHPPSAAEAEGRQPTKAEAIAEGQRIRRAVYAEAEKQAVALGRPELAQQLAEQRIEEMAQAIQEGRPVPRPSDPPTRIPAPAHPKDKPGPRPKKTTLPS